MHNASWTTTIAVTLLLVAASARADSTHVDMKETAVVCDLLGLGAVGTVPYNFPAMSSDELSIYRALNPLISETELAAGDNAMFPPVLGGDLGSPFLHGDGKLYLSVGDAWFLSNLSTTHTCPTGDASCAERVVNDDLLASVDLKRFASSSSCLPLDVPVSADGIVPITWNGSGATTGHNLGAGMVPGPGFSTGSTMFMLMTNPAAVSSCSTEAGSCGVTGGLASDVCQSGTNGVACYYGACTGNEPCAYRLSPSTLVVRRDGSDFSEPKVSEHIQSSAVLNAYRGHFSVVAFYSDVDFSTGDGKVWVVGRDGFWGMPGLTMSPYLMYHPVQHGMLGEPQYFAEMDGEQARFSADPLAAKPLYEEKQLATWHTSITYQPDLFGGSWLMLYGGHAQEAIRAGIGLALNKVDDALFYARDSGITLRWAKNPWGPWSEPITVFNPYESDQAGYCKKMYFDDPSHKTGFECPSATDNAKLNRSPAGGLAAEYGAAFVPGTFEVDDKQLKFSWLMSTWNPYRIVMLRSTLELAGDTKMHARH